MQRYLLLPLLATFSTVALAAPAKIKATPASMASAKAKAALAKINAGELRLDGKISALLGEGAWQMEAVSWTSPRGVTTDFDDLKTKAVQLGAKTFIHPLDDATPVALKEVKLGASIAVIGKPGADGSLVAREIVLLEGYGARKEVGSLNTNPESSKLIDQSRRARDDGQLPKALKLALEAADTAKGYEDLSGEALATGDVANLYAELKKPDRALAAFARVQAIGDQIGNPLAQVLGLNGQARLLASAGKVDEAIQLLERAVTIGPATPTELQISTLRSLASVYARAGKRTEAVGALTRLFPLEDDGGQKDEATATLLSLARILAKTEADTARGYLDQARPRLEFVRDDKTKLRLSVEVALALKALNDPGAAAQFEVAAKLSEAQNDTEGAAQIRALATRGETEPTAPAAPAPTDNGNGGAPANDGTNGNTPAPPNNGAMGDTPQN